VVAHGVTHVSTYIAYGILLVVPEESKTPDPVELSRQMTDASNRGDIDAWMSFFAPDAVWDMSPMDMGVWKGRAAVRSFREEWGRAYDDLAHDVEAI